MKLPDVVTIADKAFRVDVRYSRGHGGDGSVNRDTQTIVLHHDARTTNGEMLDTLCHEALEAWALMQGYYFRSSDDILISFGHVGVRTFASTFSRILGDVLTANGVGVDMTAPYGTRKATT